MNKRLVVLATIGWLSCMTGRAAAFCDSVEFSLAPSSDLDFGWKGWHHNIDLASKATLKFGFNNSCDCGSNLECDLINATDAGAGTGICEDSHLRCSDNGDCAGPANCQPTFGPPLPVNVTSMPMCVVTVLASESTGSVHLGSGVFDLDLNLRTKIYISADHTSPCPRCGGPAVSVGDTATCAGTAQACIVDAVSPLFGGSSIDCLPSDANNVTGSGLDLALQTTTGVASLTAAFACDPPLQGLSCHCPATVRLCVNGTNDGLPCVSSVDCPAGSCSSPAGAPREPNGCTGHACSAGETCPDTQIGHCEDKLYIACQNTNDCTLQAAGDCIFEPLPCFNNTITRTGSPGPMAADKSISAILVAARCVDPTSNASINAAVGLPGPAAFRLAVEGSVDRCGDGQVDSDEHCDAGALNGTPASCCAADCECKTGTLPAGCDSDGDGLANPCDNCPGQAHASGADSDGDGVGDACDNCTGNLDPDRNFNPDQRNSDCTDPDFFLDGHCPPTASQGGKRGCCDGGDVCDSCPARNDNDCDTLLSGGINIGAEGGSLPLGGCLNIQIPPGALAEDTSISLTRITPDVQGAIKLKPGNAAIHKVLLRPEGQQFVQPVNVSFCWKDSQDNDFIDDGTCNACEGGRSCDKDPLFDNCGGGCTCTGAGPLVEEEELILIRGGGDFDYNGFPAPGAGPAKQCSANQHQAAGSCASLTASCSDAPGTGHSTVARCCDKTANTWEVQTCYFSEYYMGKLAGALIPGGGKFESDCLHEWQVVNPLNEPALDRKGLLSFKQSCRDGDVTCDADGVANGICAFTIASCLAVHDPRLFDDDNPDSPLCPVRQIGFWGLVRPQIDSVKPVDAANALKLRDAVQLVAPSSISASQNYVAFSPALVGPDFCARPILFEVPLRGDKPGKAVLKTRTLSAGGVEDKDKLRLICNPSQ